MCMIFHFGQDPWWNPAVEEQAVMRIHRIGQTKKVAIRRFIVKVYLISQIWKIMHISYMVALYIFKLIASLGTRNLLVN